MAFFGTNLHAMLAAVSANAKETGLSEAASRIDSVIEFFNQEGFQQQYCVRSIGMKWEALDAAVESHINGHKDETVSSQREDAVRVQYLGRVIYAKPLMRKGDSCLFQICNSTQRVPIPCEFVIFQDRELFKQLISAIESNGVTNG